MEFEKPHYEELIVSFLSKAATEEEIDELNAWIASSRENNHLFNEYLHTWQIGSWSAIATKKDIENAWGKVNKQIRDRKRAKTIRFYYSFAKYAAVILLFTGLSYLSFHYWKHFSNQEIPTVVASGKIILQDGTVINLTEKSGDITYNKKNGKITLNNEIILPSHAKGEKKQGEEPVSYKKMAYNTIIVPNGTYYKLTLPDGTIAWVNSGSKLKYYSDIPNDIRLTELQGEAYFDVTHNKNLPFIVKVNDLEVKVLGTSFNIKSVDGDDYIKTTLVSGSVQLIGKKDQKNSFLIKINPGEQAVFSKTNKNIEVRKVDTEMYCSWKDGYFKFQDTPFTEAVNTVSRNYGIEILFKGDPRNFDKKISGKLIRSYSIIQALNNVSLLMPFEYQVQENKIIINSKIK